MQFCMLGSFMVEFYQQSKRIEMRVNLKKVRKFLVLQNLLVENKEFNGEFYGSRVTGEFFNGKPHGKCKWTRFHEKDNKVIKF